MRRLSLVVLLPLLVACGAEDYATVEPRNPDRAADGLTLTSGDTTHEVTDAVAVCVPSRANKAFEVVRLVAPASALTAGTEPSVRVEVLPGVTGDVRLPLPVRDPGAGPSDVTVVAVDGGAFSGSARGAAGTMTIREATCDPEPRLTVTFDARLGRGAGRTPLTVRGGMASAAVNAY